MKRFFNALICGVLCTAILTGCANTDIYDDPDYPYSEAMNAGYTAAPYVDKPEGAVMVTFETDYEVLSRKETPELENLIWVHEGTPEVLVRVGASGISTPSDIPGVSVSNNYCLVFLYSMEAGQILAYCGMPVNSAVAGALSDPYVAVKNACYKTLAGLQLPANAHLYELASAAHKSPNLTEAEIEEFTWLADGTLDVLVTIGLTEKSDAYTSYNYYIEFLCAAQGEPRVLAWRGVYVDA